MKFIIFAIIRDDFSMRKKRFFLDIENLSVSDSPNNSKRIKKVWISGTAISLVMGIAFALVFFQAFHSPSEKRLQNQIDSYRIKYQILNTKIEALLNGIEKLEDKDDNTYRMIYELKPVPADLRRAGAGNLIQYKDLLESDNTKIAGLSMRNIDLAMRKMQIQNKSFIEVEKAALEKEKMLASIPTIMPVQSEKIRITSLFGWRKNPFNRNITSFHSGVDFAGKPGTPIFATGDGVVEPGSGRMQGYGVVVIINHGYGYKTLYAHLSKALVKPGTKVKRGQEIGKLGRTGSATGNHLHYEVMKDGKKVNPMSYITSTLSKDEYEDILKQAEDLQKQ